MKRLGLAMMIVLMTAGVALAGDGPGRDEGCGYNKAGLMVADCGEYCAQQHAKHMIPQAAPTVEKQRLWPASRFPEYRDALQRETLNSD